MLRRDPQGLAELLMDEDATAEAPRPGTSLGRPLSRGPDQSVRPMTRWAWDIRRALALHQHRRQDRVAFADDLCVSTASFPFGSGRVWLLVDVDPPRVCCTRDGTGMVAPRVSSGPVAASTGSSHQSSKCCCVELRSW